MTVHYNQDVATERVGGFFRLLFRWRGSIYHAIWGETSIFLVLYFLLSFIYRFALNPDGRTIFEKICEYCDQFVDYIPVTFILGFYLVRVISRRWTMWENMPWPDRIALDIAVYLKGSDVRARLLRRTLVRYVNLASVLCIRDICVPVRKRFPTLDHLITAGFITPEELKLYEATASKRDSNWWIPFQWAYTLVGRAFQEGIVGEGGMMRVHDCVQDLRQRCLVLFSHDWIPIPMVYTQVCALSVYLFMTASLFGRQYLDPSKHYPKHDVDLYFPYFTLFQLSFYLGWLKVAEILINPMGCDADDFDMNYIIERNVRVAYVMVDDNYNKVPPIERDIFWGVEPDVPHTEASKGIKDTPFIGSATTFKVPDGAQQLVEPAVPDGPFVNGERTDSTCSVDKNGMLSAVRRILSRNSSQEASRSPTTKLRKNSGFRSRESVLEEIKEANENLLDLIPSDSESTVKDTASQKRLMVNFRENATRRHVSEISAPPILINDDEYHVSIIGDENGELPKCDETLSLPINFKQISRNSSSKSNFDDSYKFL